MSLENFLVFKLETNGIRVQGLLKYLCAVLLKRKDMQRDLSGLVHS